MTARHQRCFHKYGVVVDVVVGIPSSDETTTWQYSSYQTITTFDSRIDSLENYLSISTSHYRLTIIVIITATQRRRNSAAIILLTPASSSST
jgi:hypothetical protein